MMSCYISVMLCHFLFFVYVSVLLNIYLVPQRVLKRMNVELMYILQLIKSMKNFDVAIML